MNGFSDKQVCWKELARHPSSCAEIVSRSGNKVVVAVHGKASHCLDNIGDDDPALCFDWDFGPVHEVVQIANRTSFAFPPPPWMSDQYPITVRQFGFELRGAVIIKILAVG